MRYLLQQVFFKSQLSQVQLYDKTDVTHVYAYFEHVYLHVMNIINIPLL